MLCFVPVLRVCVWCVSSLSSSSLFLIPFMLTCSMMRFLSLLLLGLWSVCEFVVVHYVDEVVAVHVI